MGKFGKKSKGQQGIPTSALPDIIFILLFFFMVVTEVKDKKQKVTTVLPDGTQIQKLDDTKTTLNLYVGVPKDGKFGSEPVVEIDGKFVTTDDLPYHLNLWYQGLPANKKNMANTLVYIKGDATISMGIVIDMKQSLREIGLRNISYSAIKSSDFE